MRHSNSFTHEPLWVVMHTAWWKSKRRVATYKRRMRNTNLEIRIACSSCRPQIVISNNQRLWSAGDNDWRSKRFCFIALHCVSFTWQIVKTCVIRLRVIEGPTFVLRIPFIHSGSPNECWPHTRDACVITTRILGLRAPLVARNKSYFGTRPFISLLWFFFFFNKGLIYVIPLKARLHVNFLRKSLKTHIFQFSMTRAAQVD